VKEKIKLILIPPNIQLNALMLILVRL